MDTVSLLNKLYAAIQGFNRGGETIKVGLQKIFTRESFLLQNSVVPKRSKQLLLYSYDISFGENKNIKLLHCFPNTKGM